MKLASKSKAPLKIALIYAVIGSLWILFSDTAVEVIFSDPAAINRVQTYKGWFFVLVTSTLLFWLIRKAVERQNQTDLALRSEEEFHKTLFDLSPVALFLCRTDGTLVNANQTFASLLGKQIHEILSLNAWELTPEKDRGEKDEELKTLEETGHYGPHEQRFLHKNGHLVPVRIQGVRFHGKNEPLILYSAENLTDILATQEALRISEERHRMVLENIGEAYFEVDLNGEYTHLSEFGLNTYGVPHESRNLDVGRQARLYMDDETAKIITRAFNRIYRTGEPLKRFQYEAKLPDGRLRFVEMSAFLLKDRSGNPVGFHGLSRDVTEQKKMETDRESLENQLHQAQKMESVGRLAGGVAHDFNNLLSVILGYVEILKDEFSPTHPHYEQANAIHQAALRATSLTRQLLAFSRKQVLETRVLDLNTLLKDFEKLLKRLIGEDVDLSMALAKDPLWVKADLAQMEQVIMNLAVNARDAMPDGGKLTLESHRVELDSAYAEGKPDVEPGTYAMLAVSDTGSGMDTTIKDMIFEPFFTTKGVDKGTGLGLAVTYGIIKQHGGNIWVYSEPNQGTTFKIYLPLCREQAEVHEPSETLAHERRLSDETFVLLVEDDPALKRMCRTILQRGGYKILEAENPQAAVALAREHQGPIHLLLTDVVLPGMKGPALKEEIIKYHPEIHVLYMSGYTDNVIVKHGMLMEGVNFLQKPFTVNALIHKVEQVLKRPGEK